MKTIMGKKVCEVCGLALTIAEYDRMMDKKRRESFDKDRTKRDRQREYLEWYHSKKK